MSQSSQMSELDKLRHSAAHLLAAAVLKLWPEAKPTIGPATEQGFYYDIEFPESVSESDLTKIEATMRSLVKKWEGFERIEVSAEEARERFADNEYKLELIDDIEAAGEDITLYKSGEFVDLCRGGHVENPAKALQHFKLLSMAGAYWRGDEANAMLTRIYGTAFQTEEEIEKFMEQRRQAQERDHKLLGKKHDLFTFSELVGGGLPLWTPKGTTLRTVLDDFVWELRKKHGYQKVEIPHITKKDLYQKSGHWDKFAEELFRIETRDGHEFAMKPMNCPHHTQIFDRKQHSYREMPQRYANTTMCYRDEQSGELSGLSRVRSLTQDDAHVFCRRSQIEEEALKIWDIIDAFYGTLGFEVEARLSLSDPDEPEKYLGNRDDWEAMEEQLRALALERQGDIKEEVGEAAFYGPKLDFMGEDALGREWQVATIQLDINMPERFELSCVNEEGEHERIVMIHAAIMGSIERALSIFIEHFAGKFPLWLSPEQIRVLPITDDQHDYAYDVATKLRDSGAEEGLDIRVEVDDRSETLGSKIRDGEVDQVPYLLIVGGREEEAGSVAVRVRDAAKGEKQEVMSVEAFAHEVVEKIAHRE